MNDLHLQVGLEVEPFTQRKNKQKTKQADIRISSSSVKQH